MGPNPGNESKQKKTEPEIKETSGEIVKNPDPRANENLTEKQEDSASSKGAGSEITDGEAG